MCYTAHDKLMRSVSEAPHKPREVKERSSRLSHRSDRSLAVAARLSPASALTYRARYHLRNPGWQFDLVADLYAGALQSAGGDFKGEFGGLFAWIDVSGVAGVVLDCHCVDADDSTGLGYEGNVDSGPAVEHVKGQRLFAVKDEQHSRPFGHLVPSCQSQAAALIVGCQFHTPCMPADAHLGPVGLTGAIARREQHKRGKGNP